VEHRNPVDVGTVGGGEIVDFVMVSSPTNRGVLTAHAGVIESQVTLGTCADEQTLPAIEANAALASRAHEVEAERSRWLRGGTFQFVGLGAA
jgi:hypothetical protein